MPKLVLVGHIDGDLIRGEGFDFGHFYIELHGNGLNEGVFADFESNSDGSKSFGANPSNDYGGVTDEVKKNRVLGEPDTVFKHEIELTDEQYSSLLNKLAQNINIPFGLWLPLVNDCTHFVQEIYEAASINPNQSFVSEFSSSELNQLGVAGIAARSWLGAEILAEHGNNFLSWVGFDINHTDNEYLLERGTEDSNGNKYYIIENNVDTITTNTGSQYTLSFSEEGDDLITVTNGNHIIDGGGGADTISYSTLTEAVDIDMGAGNTYLASNVNNGVPTGSPKDIFVNIENVTGTAYNDNILGNHLNNKFIGGLGDDTLDGGAGTDYVYYDGVRSDYEITRVNSTTKTVKNKTTNEIDTLIDVEIIDFKGDDPAGGSGSPTLPGGQWNDPIYQPANDNYIQLKLVA